MRKSAPLWPSPAFAVKRFWQVLLFRVKCRLKSEASSSYLSYGWWVIEPLLHMGMFYLIFQVMLNRGTEHFVAYLLCGLIPWLWFNKSVSNATLAIPNARGIMMQTRIPVALFPSEVIAQDGVKQLPVFIVLFLFLTIYGLPPDIHWLGLLPLVLVQLLLVTAAAMLVAAITPFLPDIRYLVQTGLLMLMLGSGIFYSYDVILPEHRALFFANPMANLIRNYREILLHHQWPDWHALAIIALGCLLAIGALVKLFDKNNAAYVRVVLES